MMTKEESSHKIVKCVEIITLSESRANFWYSNGATCQYALIDISKYLQVYYNMRQRPKGRKGKGSLRFLEIAFKLNYLTFAISL